MAEYIEREAAKRMFQNIDAGAKEHITMLTPFEFAELLDEIDAADVAPVVHGRWEDVSLRFTQTKEKCTVCGGIVYAHGYKYCPNCGAKMDLEGCNEQTEI